MPDAVPPKKIGFLVQEQQKVFDALQNFLFMIWTSNPNKDMCRLILNDGSIKLWLRRDKFLSIMKDLLGPTTHELEYTLYRINQSVLTYGNWYYYDRVNNDFREVGFVPDLEKINPMELIKETRKSLIKETIQDNYKKVSTDYEHLTDTIMNSARPTNYFEKFFKVIRNFERKKKNE